MQKQHFKQESESLGQWWLQSRIRILLC